MRFLRVIAGHLFEEGGQVLLDRTVPRALQQIGQLVFVRVDPGRQPHCRACVAVDMARTSMRKRLASERLYEIGEMPQVLPRIGPRPARRGSALNARVITATNDASSETVAVPRVWFVMSASFGLQGLICPVRAAQRKGHLEFADANAARRFEQSGFFARHACDAQQHETCMTDVTVPSRPWRLHSFGRRKLLQQRRASSI